MARHLLFLRDVPRPSPSLLTAGLGGLAGTAIDVVALVALVESGVPVAVAAFLGAACGAGVCFAVNKYWAFRDPSPLSLRQVGAFGLVSVGTALMMAVAMHVVSVWGGVPYLLAKALCAALIFATWSYPAQRRIVFRAPLSLDPSSSLA